MQRKFAIFTLLPVVALGACDWAGQPTAGAQGKAKGKEPELVAHVRLIKEGEEPNILSGYARYIAADLLRTHKATRVTTLATFDKVDIYVQRANDEFASAQTDIKAVIAEQPWLTDVTVSDITAISAAGMPHSVGVVRMETIAIVIAPEILASFPERGLDVEQVAATVRQIYPGGPATPEMLEQLKALELKTSNGGTVAFSNLATMEMRTEEDPIVRTYP